ncbi:formylglycine-generating enzyme family protein [Aliikangiella sp. G2MR2-5]|uniref:formylglycine-generating enzyme family protein n=1 Tax=Aliikangiella sp. G2MR2-5 TaxID=2788943 RepID=UPI0018A9023A|nr:formylglycine-generating enzyme family protein [Aliikangiella sp. G2MR2-5]
MKKIVFLLGVVIVALYFFSKDASRNESDSDSNAREKFVTTSTEFITAEQEELMKVEKGNGEQEDINNKDDVIKIKPLLNIDADKTEKSLANDAIDCSTEVSFQQGSECIQSELDRSDLNRSDLNQFDLNRSALDEQESDADEEKSYEDYVGKMIDIPAGEFMMGCNDCYPNQAPAHQVSIDAFKLGEKEITVAQFSLYAEETGFESENCRIHFSNQHGNPTNASWRHPYFNQGRQQPVVCVSYFDVIQYIQWLNDKTGKSFRLPSEAEWEYAARRGDGDAFEQEAYSGSHLDIYNLANCRDCGSRWEYSQTAPVGSFPANKLGIYDMHGNASEWVQDCYQENYLNAPTDGGAVQQGNCPTRVVRGGSWYELMIASTATIRIIKKAASRNNGIGFRLALNE